MPLPDNIKIPLTDDRSVLLELVRIASGRFLMGSRNGYDDEEPVHEVCIPFDFYLGKFPVTQQEFGVWTQLASIKHSNYFSSNDRHPAENMSWDESVQFCTWLGERYQHLQSKEKAWPSGFQCALPSEAQWEYACNAWSETKNTNGSVKRVYSDYHIGDGEAALHQAGWYGDNNDSMTHAVGEKEANCHGLYDMHGNVHEWCVDFWHAHAYRHRVGSTIDPLVGSGDNSADRVVRGGSWFVHASNCRAAFRFRRNPALRSRFQGFRVGLFPVRSSQSDKPAE